MAKVPPVWTITHLIDETSLLHGTNWEGLVAENFEINVLFTGIDSAGMTPIYTCQTYQTSRILYHAHFVDMVKQGKGGKTIIDFRKFHRAQAIQPVNRS